MRLLREPLLHFVALGVALFLVYALASDLFTPDTSRRIKITASEIELLAENWARQWQRPPTEDELRGLVEARVREEVLYREALAVGLDQNDVVVRRRMVQKVELLSQDLALLADPTDQELQTFFAENQEEYRIPPRISFSHIYFNVDSRGAEAEGDAGRILQTLRAQSPPPARAPEMGDRFMLALLELEPGWHGPIASGYGLHLVHVSERLESELPDYRDIRDRLVVDFNRDRSERARDALYEGLRANYTVQVDEAALQGAALASPGG
jgi:hypothetical protein